MSYLLILSSKILMFLSKLLFDIFDLLWTQLNLIAILLLFLLYLFLYENFLLLNLPFDFIKITRNFSEIFFLQKIKIFNSNFFGLTFGRFCIKLNEIHIRLEISHNKINMRQRILGDYFFLFKLGISSETKISMVFG
jgi:hypothetical protein